MEQWVTLTDAAKKLGKSKAALTRLVRRGVLEIKQDTLDQRVKLVNLTQLQELTSVRTRLDSEVH